MCIRDREYTGPGIIYSYACNSPAMPIDPAATPAAHPMQVISLQVQAAELQEQLDSAKEDYKKLEEREKYMQTDEYVEDVARSQLGLIYPDEIVVKPEE